MLSVILNRFPGARILVCPVRVQGDAAAGEIAEAIGMANRIPDVDVMIVGRGGGSLEDLWPFNEEAVARAIAASRVPVVSAVGHETDFTISDFVADARALTPTAAGGLVVPDARELAAGLRIASGRLGQALLGRVERARERLSALGRSYALRRPLDRIRAREQRLDEMCQQFYRSVGHILELKRQGLNGAVARLESLSPLAVLGRGYSIAFKEPEGVVLRDAASVSPGDLVRTRLGKGEFHSRVEAVARAEPAARRKKTVRKKRIGTTKRQTTKTERGGADHGQEQDEV